MTQLDEVARRIAAMEFDPQTIFKLGVALAPIVLERDHAQQPVRKRPNGLKRKSPLERALACLAKNPGIAQAALQKRARCGAGVAKRALRRRSNGAGVGHDAEAAEGG
jgi:hypothetical protein